MAGFRFSRGFLALVIVAELVPAIRAENENPESQLLTEAARAERILVGVPQPKGGRQGAALDVPPGGQFLVEVTRAIRETGKKTAQALIINSGNQQQHPKYIAGETYLFLLKKNPAGKGWIPLLDAEVRVRDGKALYQPGGQPGEEAPLARIDELGSRNVQPVDTRGPTRDSLTGKWIVVQSRNGTDEYLWLIELTPDEKAGTSVKLLSSSQLIRASALKSAAIDGADVRLVFNADGDQREFKGRFENGTVRGSLQIGRNALFPARLVPTSIKSMNAYNEPLADATRGEFIDASQQEDSFGPLLGFVRKYPESPMALVAYAELINQARKQGYDREKFESLGVAFVKSAATWGPRFETLAYASLGLALSRRDFLPELALDYLGTAGQRFEESTPAELREVVSVERGKRLIEAGRIEEGTELLRKVRAEFPFQTEATFTLARQAEKEGRLDEAIELFGELAQLPQMESQLAESLKTAGRKLTPEDQPRRVVTRLWSQKHGDREGLPAYLDELYQSRIRSIATERRPPRTLDEGSRVALLELFTGGASNPCVAADVAALALEATYQKSELIVIRYHESVPRPDPLANEETKMRFELYRGESTPYMALNGRPLPPFSGAMAQAPEVYRRLRAEIDPMLDEKVALRLELSAGARNGKVEVSANAKGLENFPANSRLELALAEDRAEWIAPNGIRYHDMVVRTMPGSPTGVGPTKGQLSFSGEVDLPKLKIKLARELVKVEAENGPFDEHPLELKALHLVGFLRNGETGEILQAAAVPVTGLAGPEDARPAGKPDAQPSPGGN